MTPAEAIAEFLDEFEQRPEVVSLYAGALNDYERQRKVYHFEAVLSDRDFDGFCTDESPIIIARAKISWKEIKRMHNVAAVDNLIVQRIVRAVERMRVDFARAMV